LERKQAVENMKYGDERRLLWKTIAVVNALHLGVKEIARKNAAALWEGCSFKVLD
jgi:hypothetical protein